MAGAFAELRLEVHSSVETWGEHSAGGLTRSFIFKDLSDVSFAMQDTNNMDGVFL
jgi:hypothetical protein